MNKTIETQDKEMHDIPEHVKNLNITLEPPKNFELFIYLLTILFIYIKITNQADLTWFTVFIPMIIMFLFSIIEQVFVSISYYVQQRNVK